MTGMSQLYQSLIVEHSRSPRNFTELGDRTHSAAVNNPLCGDDIEIQLRLNGEQIDAATFQGNACAICTASASMMTRDIPGLSIRDVVSLKAGFYAILDSGTADPGGVPGWDAELEAFAGVAKFPVRIQCAKLPWEGLVQALGTAHNHE